MYTQITQNDKRNEYMKENLGKKQPIKFLLAIMQFPRWPPFYGNFIILGFFVNLANKCNMCVVNPIRIIQ